MEEVDRLQSLFTSGKISRREFIVRATAMGLSASSIAALLSACIPSPVAVTPTPTATRVPPTPSPVPGPAIGGTLVEQFLTEPRVLTPNYVFDAWMFYVASVVFNRLVAYNGNWEIVPDLAEKWDVSPDGKTYTFSLAKNVKWHDGQKFSSADVKWTVESIQQTKGAATASRVANVASVATPDDNTVVFTLKNPDATFLADLAHIWSFMILPKHLYENTDPPNNPYYNKPVGTGPFRFVEWQKGSSITVEASKDYWKGRPYLDRVVYRLIPHYPTGLAALEAGEIHLTTLETLTEGPRLAKDPNIRIISWPVPILFWLGFNVTTEPFNKKDARLAIAYAVDREDVSQKAYGSYYKAASYAYLPSITWAFNTAAKQPSVDPKRAEELLDKAGFPRGADGVRMRVSLVAPLANGLDNVATVIQAQLKKIGVEAKVETLEFGAYTEKVLKRYEFQLTLSGGYQGPDPSEWVHYVGTGGFRNAMRYSNKQVDDLFKRGREAKTQAERKEAYFQIQQIIIDDVPRVNMVEFSFVYLLRSNCQGLWMEPDGLKKGLKYNDLSAVHMAKR
ncbi:MAG: ABC transporter substrate-binding protein [Chloroflexi bacterium]|nr:ABC transporter substrate-binding protein [Chloroflexota bacterium]MCL5076481.1 ABC transporter substrate-binding protein [Chloroflexota bacterium]